VQGPIRMAMDLDLIEFLGSPSWRRFSVDESKTLMVLLCPTIEELDLTNQITSIEQGDFQGLDLQTSTWHQITSVETGLPGQHSVAILRQSTASRERRLPGAHQFRSLPECQITSIERETSRLHQLQELH
jgi:hypothetical protein